MLVSVQRLTANAGRCGGARRRTVAAWGAFAALLAVAFQGVAPAVHACDHVAHPIKPVAAESQSHPAPEPVHHAACAHAHHERTPGSTPFNGVPAHVAQDQPAHQRPAHGQGDHRHDDPRHQDPCGLCDLIDAARIAAIHDVPPAPTLLQRLSIGPIADPTQVRALAIATPAHPRGPPSHNPSA